MALSLPSSSSMSDPPVDADRQRQSQLDHQALVIRFYDELGVREWLHLQADARTRVIYHLHQSILRSAFKAGDTVLDVGCGPGRFSIDLTEIGAEVLAADVSPVQLALARQNVVARFPGASPRLVQLSLLHLPFRDAAFDSVVCYGSLLSHLG